MTYLVRGVFVLALWLLLVVALALGPEDELWLLFIPMVVLTIAMGKINMGRVVGVTGLTFLMSDAGRIVFYVLLVLLSPVVAPIYAMWSIARYFVDQGGPF